MDQSHFPERMKSILITGASGGMGSAAAQLLANQGYRVFALDRKACAPSGSIGPVQADITDERSLQAAFEQIRSHTDELFAIVHFAGMYMLDSLVEMDSSAFRRIFEVNLTGAYLVNKVFLPLLKPGSRILITTSELAPLSPLPFTGVYAVSKAALDKYAWSLAMELQLLDIRVSVLRAGAVSTGMLDVSMQALDAFCQNTQLYTCNAKRFKNIVGRVEARNVPPEVIAHRAAVILRKKSPAFAYAVNRNPLLLMLNALPKRLQLWIIQQVLKTR